jgi:hypothetical protein
MLLRINITVITSRTNSPTQQCTRPDARGGRTDRDRKRTSRDNIRGATASPCSVHSCPQHAISVALVGYRSLLSERDHPLTLITIKPLPCSALPAPAHARDTPRPPSLKIRAPCCRTSPAASTLAFDFPLLSVVPPPCSALHALTRGRSISLKQNAILIN